MTFYKDDPQHLVRTLDNGTEIFVTDAGKFRAKVGDKWRTAASMTAMVKIITAADRPVEAIRFYGQKLQVVRVISIDPKTRRVRTDNGLLNMYESNVWHRDPDVEAEIAEIDAQIKVLQERRSDAIRRLKHMTPASFREAVIASRDETGEAEG